MGRWAYFDNDTEHKFWFGTQSSEDITSLGGEVCDPTQITVRWDACDYKLVVSEIRKMRRELKAKWNLTYTEAMKRQDPEWCRSDESKGLTQGFWRLVARLDLALKIRNGLQENDELYCDAEYY
jgi:hypothetical protein